jgi:hypothetical protein
LFDLEGTKNNVDIILLPALQRQDGVFVVVRRQVYCYIEEGQVCYNNVVVILFLNIGDFCCGAHYSNSIIAKRGVCEKCACTREGFYDIFIVIVIYILFFNHKDAAVILLVVLLIFCVLVVRGKG